MQSDNNSKPKITYPGIHAPVSPFGPMKSSPRVSGSLRSSAPRYKGCVDDTGVQIEYLDAATVVTRHGLIWGTIGHGRLLFRRIFLRCRSSLRMILGVKRRGSSGPTRGCGAQLDNGNRWLGQGLLWLFHYGRASFAGVASGFALETPVSSCGPLISEWLASGYILLLHDSY